MAIKYDEKSKLFTAAYCQRDPETRVPKQFIKGKLKSKREAERAMIELRCQAKAYFEQRTGGAMAYRTLLARFYDSLKDRDLAKSTVDNYRLCLDAHTLPLWGNRPIDSIKADEIRRFIREALASKSRSHQKSMLKFIRGVFTYAVEAGFLPRSPVPFMQFRIGSKLKLVLNEVQANLLLEKAKQYNHEWYPHWTMALYTGMRNEELYALTKDNVDFDNRLIFVRRVWTKKDGFKDLTKSGEDRVVEIAQSLLVVLKELAFQTSDSPFVLPRIDDWDGGRQAEILRTFCVGINLPPISFHNLRASWATIMLGKGVEAVKVMKMGGWKDLKTLNNHYLRLAGVDIRGATDKLQLHDPTHNEGKVINFGVSSTK